MAPCKHHAEKNTTEVHLKRQSYGKDRVRLVKVIRDEHPCQHLVELTVRCLLEGDFESSYTQADNRLVIATDSIKNTVYVLAKGSPNVGCPERFAQELGKHFLDTYNHVSHAHVKITMHRWSRIVVDGREHTHSFQRGCEETRFTDVTVYRPLEGYSSYASTISSGLQDLVLLKTTGSSFTKFFRDRFTTLADIPDRILSTSVSARYQFSSRSMSDLICTDFDSVFELVREVTLRRFATGMSASVQATLYEMGEEVLKKCSKVQEISYDMPNRHVFSVDLEKFGLKNEGKNATVFMPINDPSGIISATVARGKAKL